MDVRPDEAELWQRARHEDGAAFAELFDLHHARVFGRALALVADVHEADGIAAAAFFELWRKRHSVPLVSGSVRPWLLVTTVNLSRNARRRTARYRSLLRDLPHPTPVEGPDPETDEAGQRIATSIGRLASVDAALFVLTALEGLSTAEAAQTVGLKPSTARVRLHRARGRLREDLRDLDPTGSAIEGSLS